MPDVDVISQNNSIYYGMYDKLNAAFREINSDPVAGTKKPSLTNIKVQKSDAFEVSLLKLAGIDVTSDYPEKIRTTPSKEFPNKMYIDIKGMRIEDVNRLVDYLNALKPDTAKIYTGYYTTYPLNKLNHSVQVDMNVVNDNLIKNGLLDKALDSGLLKGKLIRHLQTQSNKLPNFITAEEKKRCVDIEQAVIAQRKIAEPLLSKNEYIDAKGLVFVLEDLDKESKTLDCK